MALRLVLLLGLAAHKGLWEIMKRSGVGAGSSESPDARRPGIAPVKAMKVAALGALVAQTAALASVLPISKHPRAIRTVGTLMYLAGLATAIAGRLQLGDNWANIEEAEVRPEQELVTRGIYRFVRHPIYAGDLLLVAGLQLALNSWLVLGALPLAATVFRRARAEERLLDRSRPGYGTYRARTKMFVPGLV